MNINYYQSKSIIMRSILFLSTLLLCASLNAQSVYDLFAGDPFAEFNREQKHCSMRDLKACDVSVEAHRVQLTKCQDGIMLSGGYLDNHLSTGLGFSNRKFFWFSDAVISCEKNNEHTHNDRAFIAAGAVSSCENNEEHIVSIINHDPGTVWSRIRIVMQPQQCGFIVKEVQILVGRGGALRFIEWKDWWTAD
jgi:hypothetical protein